EYNLVAIQRVTQILFKEKRYDDLESLFEQLDNAHVSIPSDLIHIWVPLLIERGKFDLAVEKARASVSEKSDDYSDHLWLGRILAVAAEHAKNAKNTKQADELSADAEKSLRRALELKSDIPDTWLTLVNFFGMMDKLSEAEDVINQLSEKMPADQVAIVLAQCYDALKKNDKAMDEYKLALAAKPDDPDIVRKVAEFYQRIGKLAEAEALLKRIVDGKVQGSTEELIWARRKLALLTASKGGLVNLETARALLQKNLKIAADSTEDLRIKAKVEAIDPRETRKDDAIITLTKMIEGKQASPEDRLSLALLYLSAEKQAAAADSLSNNSDSDSSGGAPSTAWIKASEILRNLATSKNRKPQYLVAYIKALLDHGEVSNAEAYLSKLASDFPNYAATVTLQANMLVRRGRYEDALDTLKSFVDHKHTVPTDRSQRMRIVADTLEKLAEHIKESGQKVVAENYLRNAEMYYRQYIYEHPSQSLDLATFFVDQGKLDDALNILEAYWSNSDPVTLSKVGMNIVNHDKQSKEIAQRVEKVLSSARAKFKDHPAFTAAMADLRFIQNRYDEAETYYRQILEKNPGHAVAMNNLALLLALEGKNLDEALQLINKAIEIEGPLPAILDTRASVYIARKDANNALKDVKQAVADSATPMRLFHKALALQLAKQPFAAASVMQRALKGGLKKDMLSALEYETFDKLQKLAQEKNSPQVKNN
ncbi:MAG: tetratricopeptide repeat protein, partial [Thermoguttaceae bacterium]